MVAKLDGENALAMSGCGSQEHVCERREMSELHL